MGRERSSGERIFPIFGYSREEYQMPVYIAKPEILQSSPAHTGPFKHAVDIVVPNPEEQETIIRAPASGVVEYMVMDNDTWGPTEEFVYQLNFVNIRVGNKGEFVEIAHIAHLEVPVLKIGKRVKAGEPIAKAALNGWITVTDGVPDYHVHMMVGEWLDKERRKFRSRKIRWIK